MVFPKSHLTFREGLHTAASSDLGRLVQDLRLSPFTNLLPAARTIHKVNETSSGSVNRSKAYLIAAFVSL